MGIIKVKGTSKATPAEVLPCLAEIVVEVGGGPAELLQAAVLTLWQIETVGASEDLVWQGEASNSGERLVISSKVEAAQDISLTIPEEIINLFENNVSVGGFYDGHWELLLTQPVPAEKMTDSGEVGWQLVLVAFGQLLQSIKQSRQEVSDLTQELLLTNQGVLVLVEAIETWIEEELGKKPVLNGVLEKRIEENRQLIVKLQEKERALQQADRLASIGRLVAGVAHEINNPLAFIRINNELISRHLKKLPAQSKGAAPEEMHEIELAINAVFRGIDRIANIVSGLKYFSRQEKGDKNQVLLEDCIKEAWLMVSSSIKQCDQIDFNCDLPANLSVIGNKQQLEQVFMNLMENALKAIRKSGREPGYLRIAASLNHMDVHQVVVHVEDNGCGIAPEHLDMIFEPFFTRDELGTGLGLAIVQGIIIEHRGTIRVATEIGQRTVFTISLPAGEKAR